MNCVRCGGKAAESVTSEAIEMDFGLLVIRNIPCFKCEECDEIFYTGNVVEKIEEITETVRKLVQDVTIVDFAKVA